MNISMAFSRVLFLILSIFFMITFTVTLPYGPFWQKILIGLVSGSLFSTLLFSFEFLFRRYNLKAFNTTILGIFLGYLMGQALVLIFNTALNLTHMQISLQPQTIDLIKISLFLFGTYVGTFMTLHFCDEIHISIPFVKLAPNAQRKKDLILDPSALSDLRIIDLATTGLLDQGIIIPNFVIKDLNSKLELSDDTVKAKARRCLETIKKLEETPHLGLRFNETDFSEIKDLSCKLTRLARLLDANILTADTSQLQIPVIDGLKIINLHTLSTALKPLMQTGEALRIKIQRFGKEPNQGVGYLDDGTMVVVNGGGDFIGELIDVSVLSVKHTSSGRMVFCNTHDDLPLKGNRIEL